MSCRLQTSPNRRQGLRIGLVTDCHYADADINGSRHYRHSLDKLAQCIDLMNTEKVDLLIELGDFKDQNSPPAEDKTLAYLQSVEHLFQQFKGPTYHALGNHDLDSISKTQFLANVTNTNIDRRSSYYSFDLAEMHFVVLDPNYTSAGENYNHGNFNWTDPNIPSDQLEWLAADLAATANPTLVFAHQLLDGAGPQYIKNAPAVRKLLEQSQKVLAVFHGHHHAGSYSLINSIHYYTLKALIEGPAPENNAFAIAQVHPNLDITITGYANATSQQLDNPL